MKSMHFSSAAVQSIPARLPPPARRRDIAKRNPPSSRRVRQNKIRLDEPTNARPSTEETEIRGEIYIAEKISI